jgi:hypothetical protein
MARESWLLGSAAIFAVITMAATVHAGPIAGTGGELASVGTAGATVQQVANRVCWSENGVRRCRSLNNVRVYGYRSPRAYGYRAPAPGYQAPGLDGVGPPVGYGYLPSREQIETDPDVYPIGSTDWWQAMDALDRGGQGNGSGSQ